jgi:predicted DNA-binding WGR domain protein
VSETKEIFRDRVEWLGKNHGNASGKSDKFYEIVIVPQNGTYVETRRWGRFGANGQTKVLTHYSEWRAIQSAKGQISKKRAKGYTRCVDALTRLASVMDD